MEDLIVSVIPSDPDERDYNIAQFVPGQDRIHEEEFCLKLPELNVILDQGRVGACVAHSLATCKSIVEYNATNKWIDFSPFMLYGDRKETDHRNPGMRPAQALDNLRKIGMWFRRDFDVRKEVPDLYNDVTVAKKGCPDLVKAAEDFTICGYSRVSKVDDIKTALKNKMPVTASWKLYQSFISGTSNNGRVPNPDTKNETQIGAHQMTIVGWTKDSWIVINSWGVNQAHKGMYYIPYTYAPYEAWSVSDTIFPSRKKAKNVSLIIGQNSITIDDEVRELDVAPMVDNDRTYLPVRVISEALGSSVEWEEGKKEIVIRSEEAIIKMWIGKSVINVNGKDISVDVAPILINNRTLIPIRFISEHLNCNVAWDQEKQQVRIVAK